MGKPSPRYFPQPSFSFRGRRDWKRHGQTNRAAANCFARYRVCPVIRASYRLLHFRNVPVFPECRTDPVALTFGIDVTAKMIVSSSNACALWVRAAAASFDDIKLIDQPAHGNVTFRGRTGVIYRPLHNFNGEDNFAFSIAGRSGFRSGTTLYQVHVAVQ